MEVKPLNLQVAGRKSIWQWHAWAQALSEEEGAERRLE